MSTLSPLTVLIQNQSQLASQSNSPKVSPNGLSLSLSLSLSLHYYLFIISSSLCCMFFVCTFQVHERGSSCRGFVLERRGSINQGLCKRRTKEAEMMIIYNWRNYLLNTPQMFRFR